MGDREGSQDARVAPDDPRLRNRLLESFFSHLGRQGLTLDELESRNLRLEVALPVLFRDFVAEKARLSSSVFSLDNLVAVHSAIAGAVPLILAAYSAFEMQQGTRKEPRLEMTELPPEKARRSRRDDRG